MNIGIDIRSLSEKQYTGISSYTLRLLRALFEEDKKNQYFLFENAWKKNPNRPEFSGTNIRTISLRIPNKLLHASLLLTRRPRLDRLMEKRAGVKLDLFFMPNWHFASFSHDCKTVLTVHDLSCKLFPEFFSLKMRLWHALLRPKALCQRAERIITVSEHTKKDLDSLYQLPADRSLAIHLGVSPRLEEGHICKAILKKYDIQKPFILFLGTVEPRKNILGIIHAFEKLNSLYGIEDMDLIIAGGKGWLFRDIKKYIAQSSAANRIRTLSYVTEEEKWALYQSARLFLYPSFYEGFGLPPIEAMSAGVPVIASHASSFPEILGFDALLVDPYDTRGMAEAMVNVLRDSLFRDTLAKKGSERARMFTWNKTAKQTLRVFERVAKKHPL